MAKGASSARSKSSSSSGGRSNTRAIGDDHVDPSLLEYSDTILNPSGGQVLVGWGCHAKTRVELAEALPYFQMSRGSTYIEDGIVRGFLVNDDVDDGAFQNRQGYMDAEIVVAKIPPALPWRTTVRGRVHGRTRRRAHAGMVDQRTAFANNLTQGQPLIIILDRMWKDSIFDADDSHETLQTRYIVLDHFLVSAVWEEPSSVVGAADSLMVRFERLDLDFASWYVRPKITPPRPEQRIIYQPLEHLCGQCGVKSEQRYVEDWFCCNPACSSFGCNDDGDLVCFQDLTYDETFLKTRLSRGNFFQPRYQLLPDLLGLITSQQMYGMSGQLGNKATSNLWRALVCPFCSFCVPRIFWHSWRCDACKRIYQYEPSGEVYQKFSFMQDFGVSQTGHPSINIVCPPDYRTQPPLKRDTYRMDRVFLHGDAFVTLISPTDEFNQADNGPNDIFNKLLSQASVSQIPLRRRRLYPFDKHSGKRTPYFAAMYGQQYDFSSLASIPNDQTPDSVLNAEALLVNAANGELPQAYNDKFNQASLECFFDDMTMPWHTDGDRELGSTIATLSLGCDAELRIRLKQHVYQNSNLTKIIRGSYNWENLTRVKQAVRAGTGIEQAWAAMTPYNGPAGAPEISLPLSHGSIVIFQGKNFSKYFEHTIENIDNESGSLRFSITARHIDEARHHAVRSRHPYSRQAGPKFSFLRPAPDNLDSDDDDAHGDDDDDFDDSEDSDDDDYNDYSTSHSGGPADSAWPPPTHRRRRPHPPTLPLDDGPRPPMRPYADNTDSDSDGRGAPGGRGGGKIATGKNPAAPRRRGARAGPAAARARSRSPERATASGSTAIRSRNDGPGFVPAVGYAPGGSDDPDFPSPPRSPVQLSPNAGVDPDNVPRPRRRRNPTPKAAALAAARAARAAMTATDIDLEEDDDNNTPAGAKGKGAKGKGKAAAAAAAKPRSGTRRAATPAAVGVNSQTGVAMPRSRGGSQPGRILHWWTEDENNALRAAGLRVTQGLSTWRQEMVNLPGDVTQRNCRERYFKRFKKLESP